MLPENLERDAELFLKADVEITLKNISAVLKYVLYKTALPHNSEFYNLYVSCLLTLLNDRNVVLYKLPRRCNSLVNVLSNECYHLIRKELFTN